MKLALKLMAMKIAILEDKADRREAMRECLADRLYMYEVYFFENPLAMLAFLHTHLEEVVCIVLDHDMELLDVGDGILLDPGPGRVVVADLQSLAPLCPVVIHSPYAAAGDLMEALLAKAGWTVHRVELCSDVAWVRSVWLPTVRRAILDTARPKKR